VRGPIRGLCGGAGGRRKGGTNQSLLMSTPILDPNLPADNAPLVAGAAFLIPWVRRFTTGWDRGTFDP
jgi:hypothetical protein